MKNKYDEELMIKFTRESYSKAELLRKLGIPPNAGNYKTLQKYINLYNIDISHFTGARWNKGKIYPKYKKSRPLDKILVENSNFITSSHLRKRLIDENILENKCYICGIINWNDKYISLHLDHINGNNLDHRLENLRILCPNCHSQTDTFGSKNKTKYCNNRKRLRDEIFNKINENSNDLFNKVINKCINCEINIKNSQIRCGKCNLKYRNRNIPPKEVLEKEIWEIPTIQLAKKYQVSDKAIEKWCKKLAIEKPTIGYWVKKKKQAALDQ